MRINRYLAACGLCSRRDADRLVEAGRVRIDGRPAEPGAQVEEDAAVTVDGRPVVLPAAHVVYAWYKPRGVVCTARDPHAEKTVIREVQRILEHWESVPPEQENAHPSERSAGFRTGETGGADGKRLPRLTYIGRLDKDSEGLLLLTDDGMLVQALTQAENHVEKEYQVTVDGPLTAGHCARLAGGVYLKELGITTRPCEVHLIDGTSFRIVLTEGRNRQIRRMCRSEGLTVRRLVRIREGGIALGSMQPGELRRLTADETAALYRGAGLSD